MAFALSISDLLKSPLAGSYTPSFPDTVPAQLGAGTQERLLHGNGSSLTWGPAGVVSSTVSGLGEKFDGKLGFVMPSLSNNNGAFYSLVYSDALGKWVGPEFVVFCCNNPDGNDPVAVLNAANPNQVQFGVGSALRYGDQFTAGLRLELKLFGFPTATGGSPTGSQFGIYITHGNLGGGLTGDGVVCSTTFTSGSLFDGTWSDVNSLLSGISPDVVLIDLWGGSAGGSGTTTYTFHGACMGRWTG